MPYKFETTNMKIPREKDRRVKLSLEDRDKIKQMYGKISQRKLAKAFDVSRRLIQFIGDPEKKRKDLENRRLRGGGMIYYNKKKQAEYARTHRRYKKKLYDQDILINGSDKNEKINN